MSKTAKCSLTLVQASYPSLLTQMQPRAHLSQPPTCQDVRHLLLVPLLLVLCPPPPVLLVLVFSAHPRLHTPPPLPCVAAPPRQLVGVAISSEGPSAPSTLSWCPHPLYPVLNISPANIPAPVCLPPPTFQALHESRSIFSLLRWAKLKLTASGYLVKHRSSQPSQPLEGAVRLSLAQTSSRIWDGRKGRVKARGAWVGRVQKASPGREGRRGESFRDCPPQ